MVRAGEEVGGGILSRLGQQLGHDSGHAFGHNLEDAFGRQPAAMGPESGDLMGAYGHEPAARGGSGEALAHGLRLQHRC